MKLFLQLISFIMVILLVACEESRDNYKAIPDEVEGYRPIYVDTTQDMANMVYSTTPRPVQVAGKIYLFRHFLFVGEPAKGVHVFDNSNPSNPVPVCFINIPFNYDIAVKDSVMYADTYLGLVVINISEIPKIQLLKFIRSLSNSITGFPPLPRIVQDPRLPRRTTPEKVYFECIDFSRGVVAGWEEITIKEPKCYQ